MLNLSVGHTCVCLVQDSETAKFRGHSCSMLYKIPFIMANDNEEGANGIY